MAEYRHILLASDFSAGDQAVAERAVELARRYGARLSLIHVVENVPLDPAGEMLPPPQLEIEPELVAAAEENLARLAKELGMPEAARFVQVGATKGEILRVAADQQVDLIVIGSHGRHGLALLLGSTANAVLHGAPCDLLAVRIRE